MIAKRQVIELLLEACPTFSDSWDEHRRDYGDDLLYVAASDFARHLLQLYELQQTDSFSAVANVIERLHIEGDHEVQELATIGFLEGIQNVWSHKTDPEQFAKYLQPVSLKWWQSLNDFWDGKSKFVGDGL